MGRIGITYDEVAKAAHQLQGNGQNPTVDNVRAILGTGSKSTLAAHLRAWRNQQGIVRASDGAIPSELLCLIKGLWERLRETADQQIEEHRTEFNTQLKNTQTELTQTQQQQTTLLAEKHLVEEKLHQQTVAAEALQSQLLTETQEKMKLAERAAALASQQQKNQADTDRLHQLLKQVQNNLEHYQASTQALREEQTLLLDKQRTEYEQKNTRLHQQVAVLTTEKAHEQAAFKQLDQQHKIAQKALATAQSQNEKIQKQLDSVSLTHQSLQIEHQHLVKQHQETLGALKTQSQVAIESQMTLKVNADKITSLEKALATADDKVQQLRQDYALVAQEKANLAGQLKQLAAAIPRTK